MNKELKKELEELEDSIHANLSFNDKLDKSVIEGCKSILARAGCKFVDLRDIKGMKIEKYDDLINYFYIMKDKKHPEGYSAYRNKIDKDRSTAKRFVEARMKAGSLSKEAALIECREIIKTVFENESLFGFKKPINFEAFNPDSPGWITEKAINILNNEDFIIKEKKSKKLAEELEKFYEEEDTHDDYEDLLNEMEKEHMNVKKESN